MPDARKVHDTPVPRLGARVKFLTQTFAALVAYYYGYRIEQIGLPWNGVLDLGLWSIPVTVLWIVGLTNAFNLIDGLDGLASGVALIATLTLTGIALINQQVELAIVSSVLAGCLLGFLRYNFRPASIFLGDSGSLFVGFSLAVFSITTAQKATTAASMFIMILAFGLPIMDTLLAMARRFLQAAHVAQGNGKGKYRVLYLRGTSMFEADRDHIHHRLLRLGITHRNVVLVLYGVCAAAGCAALAVTAMRNVNTGLILLASGLATGFAVQKLRYSELQIFRSGALLPMTKLSILGYESFQGLMDVLMISAAYYLAWLIHSEGRFEAETKTALIQTLPALLLVKIVVFHAAGLYRIKWSHAGVPDMVRAVRAMVLGSLAVVALLNLCLPDRANLSVLIIDFFITGCFLLGVRFSVRVLDYHARSNPAGDRKALIYGAGRMGNLLVRELLSNSSHSVAIVGFIDEDPQKRKKMFHGYPVLGTQADIEAVIRQFGIQELIIAAGNLPDGRLSEIGKCCAQNGVTLRKFEMKLEEILPA
ncbi:MAG: hypothetical protein NTY01_07795 [Verrucomicrobia bacterium]|nr:hypothetical protein [Verrucomicrobiota bacterium]